ncbi:unnamed protein product, partial [Rotaria sp. Silwood1]
MNAANIIDCLSNLLKDNLTLNSTSCVSQKEREVAQHFCETITKLNECKIFEFEEETTLDVGETSNEYENEDDKNTFYDDNSSGADDEWDSKDNERERHDLSDYSLEYMKEVVAYTDAKDSSGKRRRSWKSVHEKYKRIPAQTYISRFRKYLEQQGTKRQKIQKVDEMVFQMFVEAREKNLMVHDVDIQRWGLKVAKDMKLNEFHASDGWVKNFKGRHDFYTRSSHFRSSQILNTDQVGIEKEVHSTRTLSFGGEKKTFGAVASKHATTHSYTVQPIISLDGKQIGPILLCLQEPK